MQSEALERAGVEQPVPRMAKPSSAEAAKEASAFLRGKIVEELGGELAYFSKQTLAILKFHGIYQQDDRDVRKQQSGKAYSSMVRVAIPGGILRPDQYLALDRLADSAGDGSIRITSRGGVQFHHVGKRDLRDLLRAVGAAELTTFAACGDVVRNVVSCAAPIENEQRRDLAPYVRMLSQELKPKTEAYAEIWIDGAKAASLEPLEQAVVEPLYGPAYLPRKFKIGFAFPEENTTDIYSHDLGFVPGYDEGRLAGFTMLAGGGLGLTNGIEETHPRLADAIAFIEPDDLVGAAKAVVSIHRDFGDRSNRKRARLKYVLEDRGVDWFRAEFARRLGKQPAPPRPLRWTRYSDYLGWHKQSGEKWFLGLRIVSGRLRGGQREAVRRIVERLGPEVRLTAQQNLILAGIDARDRGEVASILREHDVPMPSELPPVLRHSMACPALPTCGLALAEAERVLPDTAAAIQAKLDKLGLGQNVIHLRMTGCPNGCARTYTAEIGIAGQSPGLYSIYLGGSPMATRLARLYSHNIRQEEIAEVLRPVLEDYAAHRRPGESFGDFCLRAGVDELRERHLAVPA